MKNNIFLLLVAFLYSDSIGEFRYSKIYKSLGLGNKGLDKYLFLWEQNYRTWTKTGKTWK